MAKIALVLASVVLLGGCDSVPPDPTVTPQPTLPVALPDPSTLPFGRASAEGYVRDSEGAPIVGAYVLPNRGTMDIALGTDEDGHYSLDGYGLRPGPDTITVAAEGFETQVLEVSLRAQTRERIDFTLVRTP